MLSTVFSVDPIIGFYSISTTALFFIICYVFYVLLNDIQIIYTYIYSIFAVVLILSLSILIDLFRLGPTMFFVRGLFSDEIELYSMFRYTEFVVFFISFTLLVAMLFLEKVSKENL